MNKHRLAAIAGAVVLAAAGMVIAAPAKKPAAETPDYTGPKVCLTCHVKFAKNWESLPHNKKLMDESRKPDQKGCEACHGPGAAHVSGNRKQIVDWNNIGAAARNAICLKCHSPKVTAALWNSTSHAKMEISCTLCHNPHRSLDKTKMMARPQEDMCMPCHSNIKQAAEQGEHHKLPKGLSCSTCHDQHGSKHDKLLVEAKGDLCKKCHSGSSPLPESHSADDWAKTHGKNAKQDLASCTGCHDKAKFCDSCHVTPMPHPEGWMMGHKDKGASLAEDSACFKCHSKTEYCARCHGN